MENFVRRSQVAKRNPLKAFAILSQALRDRRRLCQTFHRHSETLTDFFIPFTNVLPVCTDRQTDITQTHNHLQIIGIFPQISFFFLKNSHRSSFKIPHRICLARKPRFTLYCWLKGNPSLPFPS